MFCSSLFDILLVVFAILVCGANAIEPKNASLASVTSYWDCCKPSCAANGKAQVNNPVENCDQKNQPLNNPDAVSSCDKDGDVPGPSFMCANQAPFVNDQGQAFAFAAVNLDVMPAEGSCCACLQLNFTDGPAQGKSVAVQVINQIPKNINSTVAIAIPGANIHGIGPKDGCVVQYGMEGEKGWYTNGAANYSDCNSLPPAIAQGCGWGFDWVGMGRSSATWSDMDCPGELTNISGCIRYEQAEFNSEIYPTGWNGLSRRVHRVIEGVTSVGVLIIIFCFAWMMRLWYLRQKVRKTLEKTSGPYEPGITRTMESYHYELENSTKEQSRLGNPPSVRTPRPWADLKSRLPITESHPATSKKSKPESCSPTSSHQTSELKGSPVTFRKPELEGILKRVN